MFDLTTEKYGHTFSTNYDYINICLENIIKLHIEDFIVGPRDYISFNSQPNKKPIFVVIRIEYEKIIIYFRT